VIRSRKKGRRRAQGGNQFHGKEGWLAGQTGAGPCKPNGRSHRAIRKEQGGRGIKKRTKLLRGVTKGTKGG